MIARAATAALLAAEAVTVEVEAETANGRSSNFTIVGLGDNAVREARERVLSALENSGFTLPKQILVNLAPAEVRKEGASFDLAIALAILGSSGQIPCHVLEGPMFYGELALDGRVKAVRGLVALLIHARLEQASKAVVPHIQRREGSLLKDLPLVPVRSLRETVAILTDQSAPATDSETDQPPQPPLSPLNLHDVHGQDQAKRALVVAAAGGHNVLMVGPPGCGKSMLARRFTTLLPPLGEREALEAMRIHSVAGLALHALLRGERPFRSPHHSVSEAGLVGGGSEPRPGEASLAHHGVLFLDELPEFRRAALEALRTPLETGAISVARAKGSSHFPAAFQLIAAMNPCPCGRFGGEQNSCRCSHQERLKYLKKISQPLLDRIDLHVELSAVPVQAITGSFAVPDSSGSPLPAAARTIEAARSRQLIRQRQLNARLRDSAVQRHCRLSSDCSRLLERAAERLHLSARSITRVVRVARTAADLTDQDHISTEHLAEALSFRYLERFGW